MPVAIEMPPLRGFGASAIGIFNLFWTSLVIDRP
jgi:hypothetical protein